MYTAVGRCSQGSKYFMCTIVHSFRTSLLLSDPGSEKNAPVGFQLRVLPSDNMFGDFSAFMSTFQFPNVTPDTR